MDIPQETFITNYFNAYLDIWDKRARNGIIWEILFDFDIISVKIFSQGYTYAMAYII